MTTPIDPFERHLPEVFSNLAAARTPDYLIDILGQTARKRQRPAWAIPGRWNPMHSFANRPALAALSALVLVVLVGGGILLIRPGQPGVGGEPTPTSTVEPSASASPSSSPQTLDNLETGQTFPAGDYRVAGPFGQPFRITLTSPWTLARVAAGEAGFTSGSGNLSVNLIENVYDDPCQSGGGPLATPGLSNVDDVIAALDAMTGFSVGATTDITIGGHAGKEFDLTNSLDPATANCVGGDLIPLWTQRGSSDVTSTNPGLTEHAAVIDVGGAPVVLGWSSNEAGQQEVDEMVQSLEFE